MRKVLAISTFVIASTTPAYAQYLGSIAANGQSVTVPGLYYQSAAIGITGSWAGTLAFEISVDGTNFDSLQALPSGSATYTTTANTNGQWSVTIGAATSFRVRSTAWSSGTASIVIRPSNFPERTAINPVVEQPYQIVQFPTTDAALGEAVHSALSTATTNATSVKASTGSIYGWVLSNVAASTRYVKIYNLASAPTCGSGTPVLRLALPSGLTGLISGGGQLLSSSFNPPIAMSSGIGYCITDGAADNNTTAVAANDVVVNIIYK